LVLGSKRLVSAGLPHYDPAGAGAGKVFLASFPARVDFYTHFKNSGILSHFRDSILCKFWFIRVMSRWYCIKKDMALHLMEKFER